MQKTWEKKKILWNALGCCAVMLLVLIRSFSKIFFFPSFGALH